MESGWDWKAGGRDIVLKEGEPLEECMLMKVVFMPCAVKHAKEGCQDKIQDNPVYLKF